MTRELTIAAVDVGSLPRIGWWCIARGGETGGTDLDALVEILAVDLDAARPVALGFEAPLWVPLPDLLSGLGKARPGEGNRAWSAGAGSGALACGLQQSAYVLAGIARGVGRPVRAVLDPELVRAGDADLVIWEAFVSGGAKDHGATQPHISDARAAAREFARRYSLGSVETDVFGTAAVSIAGLALLASGLSADVDIATRVCTVVKAPLLAQPPQQLQGRDR